MLDSQFVDIRPTFPGMIMQPKNLKPRGKYVRHWCSHKDDTSGKQVYTCQPQKHIVTVISVGDDCVELRDQAGNQFELSWLALGFAPTPAGWYHHRFMTPYEG